MSQLEPEKNTEDAWLDREDDYPDYTRMCWKIEECPCYRDCSATAWKRGLVWSYVGAEEVKAYAKRHLMVSSNHNLSANDADAVLEDVDVVVHEETYGEREQYRRHVEAAQKARDEKKAPLPEEPPPRRRSRSRSGASRSCRASGHDSYHAPWQGQGAIGKRNGTGQGKDKGKETSKSKEKGEGKGNGYDQTLTHLAEQIAEITGQSQGLVEMIERVRINEHGASVEVPRSSQIVGMRQPSAGAKMICELKFLRGALERANEVCQRTEQFMRMSSEQFKDNATIIQTAMQTLDHVTTQILNKTGL